MAIFLVTLAIVAIAMAAMAIGVAVSGRRLRGSCGGVGGDCACDKSGVPLAERSCNSVLAER